MTRKITYDERMPRADLQICTGIAQVVRAGVS